MDKIIYPDKPILMCDDDEGFLKSAVFLLKSNGINNVVYNTEGKKIVDWLKKNEVSLVILDLSMPGIYGLELLELISVEHPEIPIIILTGDIKLETAIECIKKGAYDYITKPIDNTRFMTIINNTLKYNLIKKENILLKNQLISDKEDYSGFSEIITDNEKMKAVFQYATVISQTDLPVLITGETGVGKDLLANAIHKLSSRKGNYIKLNIASEDLSLISDTLFGHVKGSYTSSVGSRKGLIEQANGGTLFLDEIGEIDLKCQVKLLRVIQDRKFYPIGSDTEKTVDVRFIFATNQDLKKLIEENKFRKDLYFRLESHHINIPPLRERLEDIPLLLEHFIKKANLPLGKKDVKYSKNIIDLLSSYDYPGNVREFEGMITNALNMMKKNLLTEDLFKNKIESKNNNIQVINNLFEFKINKLITLKEIINLWINEVLNQCKNNQTKAAKILGITRRALNNRISRNKKKNKKVN